MIAKNQNVISGRIPFFSNHMQFKKNQIQMLLIHLHLHYQITESTSREDLVVLKHLHIISIYFPLSIVLLSQITLYLLSHSFGKFDLWLRNSLSKCNFHYSISKRKGLLKVQKVKMLHCYIYIIKDKYTLTIKGNAKAKYGPVVGYNVR